MMRGVGGPLLCIGDMLSDLADTDADPNDEQQKTTPSSSSSASSPRHHHHPFPSSLNPSDLPHLFQEDYNQLDEALSSTGHSWTVLTLKLCSALETANKLLQSANSSSGLLSEKLQALESIIKRSSSAVAKAKDVYSIHKEKE